MLCLSFLKRSFCVIAFLLIVPQNLRRNDVGRKLRAHPSARNLFSSSRHGTKGFNQVSSERHYLSFLPVCDAVSLCQVLGDQCVLDSFVKGGSELGLFGCDEVEESRDILGSLSRFGRDTRKLLQDHERSTTNVVPPQVFNTSLCLFDGVHHKIIECTCGCCNSNVVLLWDGSEIPKATLNNALETSTRGSWRDMHGIH